MTGLSYAKPTNRSRRPLAVLVSAFVLPSLIVTACTPSTGPDDRAVGATDTPSLRPANPAGAPTDVKAPAPVKAPATTVKPSSPTTTAVESNRTFVSTQTRMELAGCPMYPVNNVFHADITTLPVRADSDAIIAAAGADNQARIPRSRINDGSRGGYPINVIDSTKTKKVPVLGIRPEGLSDLGRQPIPDNPKIEGHPGIAWDQHMILFDTASCHSIEFSLVRPPAPPIWNGWGANSVRYFDMTSNRIPPKATTASGFSLLAGLIRYDEVAAGRIDHAISFGLPKISNDGYVWPATRSDGKSSDPNAPRMGSWFRLRDDVDLSGFGRDALVVAEALKTHGAILKDTNLSGMSLNAENSELWDDDSMSAIRGLTVADFEVVDPSEMKVADDSYEIR